MPQYKLILSNFGGDTHTENRELQLTRVETDQQIPSHEPVPGQNRKQKHRSIIEKLQKLSVDNLRV